MHNQMISPFNPFIDTLTKNTLISLEIVRY